MPDVSKHRVPAEWEDVVCICYDDHGTKHCEDKSCIYMHCRKCEKLKRFYASYCSKCRDFYLMVFKCTNWTPAINRCWKCCTGLDGHGPENKCTPPMSWVKPKRLPTREEAAAALRDAFK